MTDPSSAAREITGINVFLCYAPEKSSAGQPLTPLSDEMALGRQTGQLGFALTSVHAEVS